MVLGFCVFHYLLRILRSFLSFYLFPFLPLFAPSLHSFVPPAFCPLLLPPSLPPSSFLLPSLLPISSLSPSADVLFPETSSNSSRDSSLFARYYQVVVFQLIESSLLLALHRLSAFELFFFRGTLLFSVLFYPKFETLKPVKEKS